MNEIEQNRPERKIYRKYLWHCAIEILAIFVVYGGVFAFILLVRKISGSLMGDGIASASVTIVACLIGICIFRLWEKKWSKRYKSLNPNLFYDLNHEEDNG